MFKREDRYIVIKRKNLKYLSEDQVSHLVNILTTIEYYQGFREPIKAVVVEPDWPEYETVWKMLEERIENDKTH